MSYSQNDPRWKNEVIGYNVDPTATIGKFGCVITSYANMILAGAGVQLDPSHINQWGKDNGAFVSGSGIWIWSKGLNLGHLTGQGVAYSLQDVNSFLAPKPNFAILEVLNGAHFVLGNQVGMIIDAADGNQKKMSAYGGFVKAHLFTVIDVAPVPATPLPVVVSGPLNTVVAIDIPIINARTQPTTASPVAAVAHRGTIHVNEWRKGEPVLVNGRRDDVWLRTDGDHWIAQAGTTSRV